MDADPERLTGAAVAADLAGVAELTEIVVSDRVPPGLVCGEYRKVLSLSRGTTAVEEIDPLMVDVVVVAVAGRFAAAMARLTASLINAARFDDDAGIPAAVLTAIPVPVFASVALTITERTLCLPWRVLETGVAADRVVVGAGVRDPAECRARADITVVGAPGVGTADRGRRTVAVDDVIAADLDEDALIDGRFIFSPKLCVTTVDDTLTELAIGVDVATELVPPPSFPIRAEVEGVCFERW